ncbi:MAG: hypothetical protein ABSH49_35215 [Bryobacteraceae bacterium]|jgi:hypothetical protein
MKAFLFLLTLVFLILLAVWGGIQLYAEDKHPEAYRYAQTIQDVTYYIKHGNSPNPYFSLSLF